MSRPSQIKHELHDTGGTTTFGKTYFSLCQLHSLPILTELMTPALESRNELYLDVERIKKDEEWTPLLKAIRENRDLSQIHIYSNGSPQREHAAALLASKQDSASNSTRGNSTKSGKVSKNYNASKSSQGSLATLETSTVFRVLPHLIGSVKECVANNRFLSKLELAGVPLRENSLTLLAKALFRNESITELSLARSEVGDSGIFLLAPSIRTVMHLTVLNLSACNLTEKGAHILVGLLKSLAVRRQADKWAWSLRLTPMDQERIESERATSNSSNISTTAAPRPLKRLNLCKNKIGDYGCETLLDLVQEEVGLLALDLQMNGLTDKSGIIAKSVLKNNIEIVILDLRNNTIDGELLYSVHQQLAENDKRAKRMRDQTGRAKRDPDLHWLDGTKPLKNTYHFMGSEIRQHLHTKSTLKKKNFASIEKPRKPTVSHRSNTDKISTLAAFLYPPKEGSKESLDDLKSPASSGVPPAITAIESHLAFRQAQKEKHLNRTKVAPLKPVLKKTSRQKSSAPTQRTTQTKGEGIADPIRRLVEQVRASIPVSAQHNSLMPNRGQTENNTSLFSTYIPTVTPVANLTSATNQSTKTQDATAKVDAIDELIKDSERIDRLLAQSPIMLLKMHQESQAQPEALHGLETIKNVLLNETHPAIVETKLNIDMTSFGISEATDAPKQVEVATTVNPTITEPSIEVRLLKENEDLKSRIADLERLFKSSLQTPSVTVALNDDQPTARPPQPSPLLLSSNPSPIQLTAPLTNGTGTHRQFNLHHDSDGDSNASASQLDKLIQLMESSLSNFQGMLDQMDRQEERKKKKKKSSRKSSIL